MDDSERDISSPDAINIFTGQQDIYKKASQPVQETGTSDEAYDFSHPKRGLAFIIINSHFKDEAPREGWENDMQALQEIFTHLGFEIRTYVDKKTDFLLKELISASKEDHSDHDCFVLAVSSHGDETIQNNIKEDVICTTDSTIRTRKILEMFTDKACSSLIGKPRIIFIQACRGHSLDDGQDIWSTKGMPASQKGGQITNPFYQQQESSFVSDMLDAVPMTLYNRANSKVSSAALLPTKNPVPPRSRFETVKTSGIKEGLQRQTHLSDSIVIPAPCFKDFLVMYAAPPGFYAFRRPGKGSWFVKCLAEVLLSISGNRSLTQELTTVIGKVAREYESCVPSKLSIHKKKQCPVMYSMLTKDVFLASKITGKLE